MENLELAKPGFIYFIKNMNPELSKWIQYNTTIIKNGGIYLKFKSSQNSLTFEVYAGVNLPDSEIIFLDSYNDIYYYFRDLKYKVLEGKI